MYRVTFSVVVYRHPLEELRKVIQSLLLYGPDKIIYVVDNSPQDDARALCEMNSCIDYCHFPENLGFGKAHNLAFRKAMKQGSTYHFIVNPDIFYDTDVVTPMVEYMDLHEDVGFIMPKILYPDGRIQYLPKLMPSPKYLIERKLKKVLPGLHRRWMQTFEMRPMRDDRVYDVGHVSGCFSAVRIEAIRKFGIFDERFFMYFEDTDLTRRLHRHYRTVYFPMVSVYHDYGNGASKSLRLFFVFLASLVKFFNKWGWFHDKERTTQNEIILKQIK